MIPGGKGPFTGSGSHTINSLIGDQEARRKAQHNRGFKGLINLDHTTGVFNLPRKCVTCERPDVDEINTAILNGTPLRNIAEYFSISQTSLFRHKQHLPKSMIKAQEAQEISKADNLLEQVKDLRDKALIILAKAEKAGELKTALQGIKEARSCLELLARLQGELQQEGTLNVILAPQWVEIRSVILSTLEPFPEARKRLLVALENNAS